MATAVQQLCVVALCLLPADVPLDSSREGHLLCLSCIDHAWLSQKFSISCISGCTSACCTAAMTETRASGNFMPSSFLGSQAEAQKSLGLRLHDPPIQHHQESARGILEVVAGSDAL